MVRKLGLLALFGLWAAAAVAQPAAVARYVVELREGVRPQALVKDDRYATDAQNWGYLNPDTVAQVVQLENRYRFKSRHVYSSALKGFAVALTDAQFQSLRLDPGVLRIQRDGVMRVHQLGLPSLPALPSLLPLPALSSLGGGSAPPPAPAQLTPDNIRAVKADQSFSVAGDGQGAVGNVNVYVVDTGIASHPDLNLVRHVNFVLDAQNTDCHGHGTHVAGIIAASDNSSHVVGVAPGARLTALKVLGCDGSGPTSDVIKGVDWLNANALRPAVANLSISGDPSDALDLAVRNTAAKGMVFALAAGNQSADACAYSPSRLGGQGVAGVLVLGATSNAGQPADFSNFGPCVNLWAPGLGITSTSRTGGLTDMSGTSMAAPHATGAAALWLSLNPSASSAAVQLELLSRSAASAYPAPDGAAVRLLQANIQ